MMWNLLFRLGNDNNKEQSEEADRNHNNNEEDYYDVTKDLDYVPPSPPSSPIDAASPHWAKSPAHSVRKPSGFSPFVAFCFTINYILGTGFLTIPWAFVQGGLALSTILLILAAVVADISKDYILETMARAEAMLDGQMHWIRMNNKNNNNQPQQKQQQQQQQGRLLLLPANRGKPENERLLEVCNDGSIKKYGTKDVDNGIEAVNVVVGGSQPSTPIPSQPTTPEFGRTSHHHHIAFNPKYLVKSRKFEVNTLCRIFLGKFGLKVYTSFICLYMCGLLWAYTSVFSSAMARAVPIFQTTNDRNDEKFNYTCYALIFGSIVVPLSCLELEEQVTVQVFLTGSRFVMLFLMLGTADLCAQDMEQIQVGSSFDAPLFQPNGLHKMLPIIVVANMYHHSIPGLSKPVADKKMLGKIFQSTSIFTTLAYSLLGVVLGSAFGNQVEQSSNLNWKYFHAGTGRVNDDGDIEGAAWWTKVVSWYIICFPCLDVISAFPLNAITVANNMFGAYYGKRIHEVEDDRWRRTQFRLLATIPPIGLGLLVRELGVITDYTGTTGFVIGLSIPAILYIKSKQQAEKRHYKTDTFYTSYGSSNITAQTIFWFGLIMVVGVFSSLLLF